MRKLITLASNLFFTIDASRSMVQSFVFDHIKRLEEHNNPKFAAILAAITALWEATFGSIESYKEGLNEQVLFTKQVKAKLNEFTNKVVIDLEAAVIFKFKKDSTQYLNEFFPHGKSEYHKVNQPNSLILMDRIVDKTTKYSSDIGDDWKTEFTAIHDDYDTLLATQKGKKVVVDDSSSDYEEGLMPLYEQLYQNACTICAEYYKKPDRLLDFFDETLINYVSHTKAVLIQKNSREAFELNWTAENDIYINNKSNGPIKYFFAPTADAETGTPCKSWPRIQKENNRRCCKC